MLLIIIFFLLFNWYLDQYLMRLKAEPFIIFFLQAYGHASNIGNTNQRRKIVMCSFIVVFFVVVIIIIITQVVAANNHFSSFDDDDW